MLLKESRLYQDEAYKLFPCLIKNVDHITFYFLKKNNTLIEKAMIKFYIKSHFSELILLKIQCQRGTWKLVHKIWKSGRIDGWVHLTLLNFIHCALITA